MLRKIINYITYPVLIAVIVLCLVAVAQAATGNIDAVDKWAWGTNVGWINFAPTHGGVTVYDDHLEGYAWGENIGWIRLGSHEGGGSHTYANTAADNYGVNNSSGTLFGYAWGTNVGWIKFNPTDGGVTIDTSNGSFDGYAWGENIGWIHFKGTGAVAYNVVYTFPEMDVQGQGVSIDDGDAIPSPDDDTDFGCGIVSVDHTFTIYNTGTSALNLTDAPKVAIGGAHAADFSVTAQPASPLAAGGGTTTFTVRFDPSAAGLRSATLSIANDDADENPYDFAIQGSGPASSADFNCSGEVNAQDLSVLVSQWGECAGCIADLNGDGWVNLIDLSILVSQWEVD